MSEIPEDVLKAARGCIVAKELEPNDLTVARIARAILAERKRCAAIARRFTDTTPFAGEVIANDIEFGEQP